MKNFINNLLNSNHPVYIQGIHLVNLLVIALSGKIFFDLQISWAFIIGVVLSAIIIDHFFIYLRDKKITFFSISSVITAIGFVALSYSYEFFVYPIILLIALGQKYYLRIFKDKHIFNPSNLAVTLSFLLFPTISMPVADQWGGDNFWFLIVFITLAFYIVARVNRLAVTLSFLVSYVVIFALYFNQIDSTISYQEFFTRMFAGSFIIYAFFMLTDIRATSDKTLFQILFGFLVSVHTFLLTLFFNVNHANLFFGLTLTMIIFPVIEKVSEYIFFNDKSEKKLLLKSFLIILIYIIFILMMVNYFNNNELIYLKNN